MKIPLILSMTIAVLSLPALAEVIPLERAHSHNDYTRKVPLQTALEYGVCSVEADIHLVDGELLVAHDLDEVEPGKTLQSLYLDPLKERIEKNGGWVYSEGISLTLLIDFKSHGLQTYEALKPILEQYKDILTRFTDEEVTPGPVTVIVSGSRPKISIKREKVRLLAVDGRLGDLDRSSPNLIPLVSYSFSGAFTWDGTGPFPDEDQAKLDDIVKRAHANGQRVRFWALPRPSKSWPILYEAGVDLINADNLDALQRFLLKQRTEKE